MKTRTINMAEGHHEVWFNRYTQHTNQ